MGKGGGGKKNFHKGSKAPNVAGPGIFATCPRKKEQRCEKELFDLLEETADRLYPAERIASLRAAREALLPKAAESSMAADGAEGATVATGEDESDESSSEEEEDEEDLSIEAQVARELEELEASRPSKRRKLNTGGPKVPGERKPKPRFQLKPTATECLVFIAVRWPYDPVELCEEIVTHLRETKEVKTRFTQRLHPCSITAKAVDAEEVNTLSTAHIRQAIRAFVARPENAKKYRLTYQIEPVVRSHVGTLSRQMLQSVLGASVTSSSIKCPGGEYLKFRADLTHPDLAIIPCVLKSYYGLSVVSGKLWAGSREDPKELKGNRFNLETENKNVLGEMGSRVETSAGAAGSGSAPAPPVETGSAEAVAPTPAPAAVVVEVPPVQEAAPAHAPA